MDCCSFSPPFCTAVIRHQIFVYFVLFLFNCINVWWRPFFRSGLKNSLSRFGGNLDNATPAVFASHVVSEICSQLWVRDKLLSQDLCVPDYLLDTTLANSQVNMNLKQLNIQTLEKFQDNFKWVVYLCCLILSSSFVITIWLMWKAFFSFFVIRYMLLFQKLVN